MRSYVDSRLLDGSALRLQPRSPGVFTVVAGDLAAGGIVLRIQGQGQKWCWSLTGPQLPVTLQPGTGEAETLAEAQHAMRAKFEAWRQWAQGAPAVWNG